MNPRHAAALALVGWYLMVPPGKVDVTSPPRKVVPGSFRFRPNAPIAQWEEVSVFDSAKECEDARTSYSLDDLYRQMQKPRYANDFRPSLTRKDIASLMATALCVATDDPRLKEK